LFQTIVTRFTRRVPNPRGWSEPPAAESSGSRTAIQFIDRMARLGYDTFGRWARFRSPAAAGRWSI